MTGTPVQRLTVGMCGASGAPLALAVLRALRACAGWESHVIVSRAGWRVLAEECGAGKADVAALAHYLHEDADIGACVASGTFRTAGMLIVPCSMKTLAGIHSGYADSLLLRAADVTLKERRPLVLAVRESPFSPVHLRNMAELAGMGVIIMPPVLTYYQQPRSVEDMTTHMAGKLLAAFGLPVAGYRPWCGG